ncbi:hypothetical protein KR009_005286 [Drosophila setifemur]|nr:hypothetical protein KR009_005286 [Drosophila setifemur]
MQLNSSIKEGDSVNKKNSDSRSFVGLPSTQRSERHYTELDSEGHLVSRALTPYECQLEDNVEQLQEALFTISSHYAKIQFRLRQIASAPAHDRDCLLKELEYLTGQGLDGCDHNKDNKIPSHHYDSNNMGSVRAKQHKIISQLRGCIDDLVKATGVGLPPLSFQGSTRVTRGAAKNQVSYNQEQVKYEKNIGECLSRDVEPAENLVKEGYTYLQDNWSNTDGGHDNWWSNLKIQGPKARKNRKNGKAESRQNRTGYGKYDAADMGVNVYRILDTTIPDKRNRNSFDQSDTDCEFSASRRGSSKHPQNFLNAPKKHPFRRPENSVNKKSGYESEAFSPFHDIKSQWQYPINAHVGSHAAAQLRHSKPSSKSNKDAVLSSLSRSNKIRISKAESKHQRN